MTSGTFHSHAWPTQYPVTLEELERRIDGIFRDLIQFHSDIWNMTAGLNEILDAHYRRLNALEIRLQKLEGKEHV